MARTLADSSIPAPASVPARSLAACVLLCLLCAGCAGRGPFVALDEQAWSNAARIELVYVADHAPGVEYLPAPAAGAKPAADAPGAADGRDAGCLAPADAPLPAHPALAAWSWDTRAAAADPAGFAASVAQAGVGTLFLQLQPEVEAQAPLIEALVAHGVRVIALDGYPDAASRPDVLGHDIEHIHDFNTRHGPLIAGYHVDVEPYLVPGFRLDAEAAFGRYLALLQGLRKRLGPGLEFSAAVPFWYVQEQVAGRNLAEAVIEATDAVAVMAYRTDRAQVEQLARPTLCLAARHGRRAWVGLEDSRLEDEVHLVLGKAALRPRVHRESGALLLGVGGELPVERSYVVKADDLSFHARPRELRALLSQSLRYGAFAGWAVNGLSLGDGGPLGGRSDDAGR